MVGSMSSSKNLRMRVSNSANLGEAELANLSKTTSICITKFTCEHEVAAPLSVESIDSKCTLQKARQAKFGSIQPRTSLLKCARSSGAAAQKLVSGLRRTPLRAPSGARHFHPPAWPCKNHSGLEIRRLGVRMTMRLPEIRLKKFDLTRLFVEIL